MLVVGAPEGILRHRVERDAALPLPDRLAVPVAYGEVANIGPIVAPMLLTQRGDLVGAEAGLGGSVIGRAPERLTCRRWPTAGSETSDPLSHLSHPHPNRFEATISFDPASSSQSSKIEHFRLGSAHSEAWYDPQRDGLSTI